MDNQFQLEHIGITSNSHAEAEQLSLLLCRMFNLNPRHGKKSEFAGDYFECMREPFLGTHGHIAMTTANLESAVKELEEKGFLCNMKTASYNAEGRLNNLYLEGEFGGFAIHIMQKT